MSRLSLSALVATVLVGSLSKPPTVVDAFGASAFLARSSGTTATRWQSTGTGSTSNASFGRTTTATTNPSSGLLRVSTDASVDSGSAVESDDGLGLTPGLRVLTDAFSSIPDEKTRHKQLLYMASKLPAVEDAVRVPENKVPGCLSTVHVDCEAEFDDDRGTNVVKFVGDSDGLLTKGLLALLVRGLSGCTAEEISRVNPEFIKVAKISQTLTPGRNNGFLNMLAVMKRKAAEAEERAVAEDGSTSSSEVEAVEKMALSTDEENVSAVEMEGIVTSFEEREGKPMYNAIMKTLVTVLKPTSITLVDNSDQHAGHAGSKGWEESGESHFALDVVAEAFEGLNLVKRHQLVYMLLGDVMSKIHALEIRAKSPSEVESS